MLTAFDGYGEYKMAVVVDRLGQEVKGGPSFGLAIVPIRSRVPNLKSSRLPHFLYALPPTDDTKKPHYLNIQNVIPPGQLLKIGFFFNAELHYYYFLNTNATVLHKIDLE